MGAFGGGGVDLPHGTWEAERGHTSQGLPRFLNSTTSQDQAFGGKALPPEQP